MRRSEADERARVILMRLDERRKELGLSVQVLAQRSGIDRSGLHTYLAGAAMPLLPNLIRLADALQTDLEGYPRQAPLDADGEGR